MTTNVFDSCLLFTETHYVVPPNNTAHIVISQFQNGSIYVSIEDYIHNKWIHRNGSTVNVPRRHPKVVAQEVWEKEVNKNATYEQRQEAGSDRTTSSNSQRAS